MRLKEKYEKEVVPKMKEILSVKSRMAVPKIEKVVLNIGFGKEVAGKSSQERKKIQQQFVDDLALISGQLPVLTKAKSSISSFKIRKGMEIGAKVTLRGKRMYDFLDRLIHISLPRSRDFRGILLKSFDKKGNLTIAVKEHISFPEILPEKIKKIFSFEVTVITTAKNKEQSIELFKLLGFPIKS